LNFTKEKEMADFRKWVLVLAVLALATSVANAQIACTATSGGVSNLVRAEGLAELTGDILLSCTSANGLAFTPATAIQLNFQVFLNTNITSRSYTSTAGAANGSEALLLLDEPGSAGGPVPVLDINVFQGRLTTQSNSIVWPTVTILHASETLPAGSTRVIRITNVRANATTIPSGTGLPGTIQAFLSTGTQTVSLSQSTVTVAGVLNGLREAPAIRNGTNGDSYGNPTLQQCTGLNKDFAGSPTNNSPALTFQIRYRENFQAAFKVQGVAANQTVPGQQYYTESGLQPTNVALNTVTSVGQATQGTRLFVRFSNVPTGVRIFVTQTNVNQPSGSSGNNLGVTPTALLIGFDPTAGAYTSVATPLTPPTTMQPGVSTLPGGITSQQATSSGNGFGSATIFEVPLTGGTGSVVWEVASADPGNLEELRFGVVAAYPANLTIATSPTVSITANAGFASISTVGTMSQTAPIPRFVDNTTSQNVFSIALCVTNLLFPYVTNQGGFDTGIALVNTSLDNATGSTGTPPNQPFNTTTQHGICTVYYFGSMASGGSLPTPQTTTDIAAGQMVIFAISQGGVAGATSSAAGF
jgi:hypothetical protein